MSMNSPHESVKDIAASIWRNNRPFAIALLLIAVVVGFVIWKRSQATTITPTDVQPSATGIPGSTYNQPGQPGQPGPPGPQGPPGQPGQIVAPPQLQVGVAGLNYGLIPSGRYSGPSYSNLKAGTYYQWAGVKYLLSTGPKGKLYGRDPAGRMWLLYEPTSFYPGGTNYGK